jgi:UDPglucose 6-dehydrogenase
MDIRSAEMVKYAANAMLATKISFINEIANLCESYDADVDAVWKGMTSDSRIGNKFLYPGLGYGGSCFPKDVQAVVAMGRQAGKPVTMLEQVHAVNQKQRERFMAKVDAHFGQGGLKGKKVAVWGIAFKPGTDDIREAPSLTLMEWLLERGAQVCAFDPVAEEACRKHGEKQNWGDRVAYARNKYDALDGAAALVICTDWPQFKQPDFAEIRARMAGTPAVFDGRNLWKPKAAKEEGIVYASVGRRTA